MRSPTRILLFAVLVLTFRIAHADDYTAPGVTLTAGDPAGTRFKPLEALEVGDSLSVALSGARPRTAVEILLEDDRGREWSYCRVHSDARGGVPQTLFWYQSGVIGTTTRRIEFKPDPAFVGFDEAEDFFARSRLRLTVRKAGGRLLAERNFRPRPRLAPLVYPSNAKGVLENAVNAKTEDLYVSGRHFPAGAKVRLFLVPNRFGYAAGDAFTASAVKTVQLGAGQTSFTVELWNRADTAPGAYDVIARVGSDSNPVVLPIDVISFGEDTGVVLYSIVINGNTVLDSAGRMKDSPAYFEFSDAFEKGEDVYAAVDPTDVPDGHTGGSYGAYWTVDHQSEAYWDGPNPVLTDVSGDGPEIHRVKFWCINNTRVRIWNDATQAAPIAAYDVIVDFGAVPAATHDDFVHDNLYTKGLDFIDGYQTVGFWVYEDPGNPGPTAVGTVELLEPNGISGITDPNGLTGPVEPVTLAWARIMYPATAPGTGTPVAPGGPYPVALFLHGRHSRCDADGAGPQTNAYPNIFDPCPQSDRIPSHEGYNYIMQSLASHGIFCISINAYDIQPGLGAVWDIPARGRLVLTFLDKLRDWTNNGSDPFGALFNGKLDMSRVALSGHSRGGEGVASAQVLNGSWPNPHSILAVNAIAPTDRHAIPQVPTASYYLLIGARDGDVNTMHGYRTYDRAFPNTMMNRKPKAIAWVYGANHNYFNTVWTSSADLGMPNPWANSQDDCPVVAMQTPCSLPMASAAQRQIALTTVSAFFRWHLQGITPYREILTGVLQPAAMDNANVFRTFQDTDRKAVDDFEQQPPFNETLNTVNGMVTAPGFSMFQERLLNNLVTSYNPVPLKDTSFFHDTIGLKLAWGSNQTYTTSIPAGPDRDVSMYTHLTVRVAKKATGPVISGPDLVLYVNIEDSLGNKAVNSVPSSQFSRIPHPFAGSELGNQALMSGIRIPLRYFTMNNSTVDLTDIAKITISTEGSAEIGVDDIEFGK